MFEVRIPFNFQAEVRWVFAFIFEEILGLDYRLVASAQAGYCVSLNGKRLDLPDTFFVVASTAWLKAESVPSARLAYFDVSSLGLHVPKVIEPLPILFGTQGLVLSQNSVTCNLDIIGSIFFMLSAYQEVAIPDRDRHDRFPASESVAQKNSFLYRPIVDEYVELLWACMKYLWPQLVRKSRQGGIFVTCDVDSPFDSAANNARRLVHSLGGDLLKRRNMHLALRRMRNVLASRSGDYRFDPCYTFDWYLETCERYGRQASFYFIPDHPAGALDCCYELTEPRIQALIRKVSDRGHEVGVHSSYNSYQDATQIVKERRRMISACKQAGADARAHGNRQHFLRWDTMQTPDHLETAGFKYDTTGAFADAPGFRYGTSRSFAMWSWRNRAPLKIKQRPLVVMECTVIAERYLGLGYTDEALDLMLMLKGRAIKYGGDFTLLWHNDHLLTRQDREYFVQIIG